ncbi:MAG: phosphoribosyltransferase family protein, partial [Anaerovoracaceae bacterium]
TSDIMFDPNMAREMAPVLARKFKDCGANYVATIETKGIPLALMTAHLLNLPTIVVRRETKISEGPTVSINYFSGSTDRIQKMSMAKKATVPGSKALIVDDFMRAGGSLKGIAELLGEFDVEVCGIGVAIASVTPEIKKVSQYTPLVYLGNVDEDKKTIEVFPNSQIF